MTSFSTQDGGRPPAPFGGHEREIIGRSAELDPIDACLDRLEREAAAIVFEGPAGIGKTTVWAQVFERARRRGLEVLSCRPAEAEAKLAFASLSDLLEPVADAILPQLPDPQRRQQLLGERVDVDDVLTAEETQRGAILAAG